MPPRFRSQFGFFFTFSLLVSSQSISYAEDYTPSTTANSTTIEREISDILSKKTNDVLDAANFEYRADEVDALYKANNYSPLWINVPQSEKNITDVLALLLSAENEGLNPNDYSANRLQQKLPVILLNANSNIHESALYDTALTISLVRLLHDVHYGKVSPRSLNFKVKMRTEKDVDLVQLIQTALHDGTLLQILSQVEPKIHQYHQFRAVLTTFSEEKNRKKAKHLNDSDKILKIKLAMERLRWIPDIKENQWIIVNIPAFKLWEMTGDEQTDSLNVVVGKAEKSPTPVIVANMNSVEFMPYWNVPPSIWKKEIQPKLARNPHYLAGQNMEVVSTKGGMRVRQRPGGKNALGRLKFIFPNPDGVYLHDTPSKALFSRPRCDFSHGCVRVQNPSNLARFVLSKQDSFSPDKVESMLQSNQHRQIGLRTTIPVLFFYSTAFFDGSELKFYGDIYGHDAALLNALSKKIELPESAFIVPEKVYEPVLTPIPEFDTEDTSPNTDEIVSP